MNTEILLEWARYERQRSFQLSEPDPRFDADRQYSKQRAAIHWHAANLFARVANGEDIDAVLADEAEKIKRQFTGATIRAANQTYSEDNDQAQGAVIFGVFAAAHRIKKYADEQPA